MTPMQSDVLPIVHTVMGILSALSAAWTVFHLVKAGLGIMGGNARAKEEGVARFKFVIIGALVSLSTYFLSDVINVLATHTAAAGGGNNPPMIGLSTPQAPPKVNIPGQGTDGNPIIGWVISAVTYSIDQLMDGLSGILWVFSGFSSQTMLIKQSILSDSSGAVLGMFAPKTWGAMMYVQHTLMWIVGLAALISFIIQGMQIQSSPSSVIARERTVETVKVVLVTAFVMTLTPELMYWATWIMSKATMFVFDTMQAHTQALNPNRLAKSGGAVSFASVLYSEEAIPVDTFFKLSVSSNLSFANSLFRLIYSIINLLTLIVYTWRRVFMALWITFLPLFYIGLVTGRNKTLIIHWWKEFIAYLVVPFVAALFLFASFVFIGM